MRRFPLPLLPILALGALACGAARPTSAAAEPRKKPAKAAPGRHAAKAPSTVPAVIGAATAERVKKAWEVAAGGQARAVAVSSKTRRVAFAGKDTVELFDLYTGKPAGSVNRCKDIVHAGIAFHGGDLLIVCDKSLVVVDALKQKPKLAPAVDSSRVTAAAFAGARFALGHHDGVIRIYGLDGSASVEIRVPGPPIDVKSLALTRDGSRVAVAWTQGSIWWWDVARPNEPHDLVRHESESDAIAFSDDASQLAEEGAQNVTTVWDFAATPKERDHEHNGSWVKKIAFTRDGKWMARGGSDGVELAEIGGPKRVLLDSRSPVEDVAFDEAGVTLAAADRDGRLTLWAVR